jgi:D-alanyl-D-alanine carboxypeptidase
MMKKWVFGIVVLALLSYGASQHELIFAKKNPGIIIEENQAKEASVTMRKLLVDEDHIYEGNLLLINKDHRTPPEGVQSEAINLHEHIELVQGFGLLDTTIELSASMVTKFTAMIEAAHEDGVSSFIISSGYRDNEQQDQLYELKGAAYALPAGYSEHNLGLSLDIGSTQAEMNVSPEGKWLKKNAWEYGFILRYPENKTAITGIQYEPWHFRYVGLPHSAIMYKSNLVLEEYLDYLKQQKTVTTTIGNQTYEIYYYPVSGKATISVPAKGNYEISGNNMDGIIVTVYTH